LCEEAELLLLLPAPLDHLLPIADEPAAERQDQREGVLRDRVNRVASDVRDDDPALFARLDIERVVAGRWNADHFQVR
jgi:hypothetical protein